MFPVSAHGGCLVALAPGLWCKRHMFLHHPDFTVATALCVTKRCAKNRPDKGPCTDTYLGQCKHERVALNGAERVIGTSSAAQAVQQWIHCRYVLQNASLALQCCTETFEMDCFGDKYGPDQHQQVRARGLFVPWDRVMDPLFATTYTIQIVRRRSQILDQWRKGGAQTGSVLPTPAVPKSGHRRFTTTIIEPDAKWKVHHIRNINVPWDDRDLFGLFEWIVVQRGDKLLISQYNERFTNRLDLAIC